MLKKSSKSWKFLINSCSPLAADQLIGLVGRVFANGPEDLDTSWLNTQQYKVRIKGKVEQFRERSNALPYTSV